MDIISIEKVSRFYWLGRYTERVFSTLKMYFEVYDDMIDINEDAYISFCENIGIDNIYETKEDFCERYIFDNEDPNSIVSNFIRGMDNAVMLRGELSSQSLAYLQMALDKLLDSKKSKAPIMELLKVIDLIYAFWSSADDYIISERCRNILKTGRYLERVELFIRMDKDYDALEKEFYKLKNRICKSKLSYNKEYLRAIEEMMSTEESYKNNKYEIISCLGGLIN